MTRPIRLLILCALTATACRAQPPSDPVTLDGSSTVYPLADAVAREFTKANRRMPVTVTFSGTTVGMVKFCHGLLDIATASRPITVDEQKACETAGVSFVELPVGHDAITVIVNAKNTWASSITVPELRTLWEPQAEKRVTKWSDIRKDWPARDIKLFGPGKESGTFDYFTEVINGGVDASRSDYTPSGDDHVIVDGVAGDELALGYVGYGYFERNRQRLKAVAVDDLDDHVGQGPIEPSPSSVGRGLYRPLSRPLFIYLNVTRARRPEVVAFARYFVRNAGQFSSQAGTMPLAGAAYQLAEQRLTRMTPGTMFKVPRAAELGVEDLLTR